MKPLLPAVVLLLSLAASAQPPGPDSGFNELRQPDTKATQGSLASVFGGLGLTAPIVYMLFHAARKRSKKG